MTRRSAMTLTQALNVATPDQPVLIAGPTASGKSALALQIAQAQGGVIINADASQVYDCWRVLTARPSAEEEARAPHLMYGHISAQTPYSTGHWLREVTAVLAQGVRPIIVGGTGLYFSALTQGLADIPLTPPQLRHAGDALSREALLADLDAATLARIDTMNRARVQRAWEVLRTTGKGLAEWQDNTPPPALSVQTCAAFVMDAPKDWLNARIERRFDMMLCGGALEEIAQVAPNYDPSLPAHRAIGVPELMAFHRGEITRDAARTAAVIATRQFAKRQRTWFRARMKDWQGVQPE